MAPIRHPEIGEKWQAARDHSGLSVQEAAEALGVHRNTIYKLENGDEDVTLRMMLRVATLYGQTLAQILCDEGQAAERTPIEFRPLLEPLRPLSVEQRSKIVKNIASNLDFMHTLYSTTRVRDEDHQTISSVPPYNHRPTNTERTDTEEREEFGAGPPMGNHANAQNGSSGTATSRSSATAATRKTGKQR